MRLAGHVAIYGGSFNPPHVAHQMGVLYLLESLGARAVWVLPAHNHPFGKPLAPFTERVAMCEAMLDIFGARARVETIERELGTSRTFDVLSALVARHPSEKLAFCIGADIVAETHAWYRWPEIAALVPIVVLGRQGHVAADAEPVALPAVSSSDIRGRLARRESVQGLVPAGVARYIAEHRLYAEG